MLTGSFVVCNPVGSLLSATPASAGAKGASETPAAKKQRVTSPLERRRVEHLVETKGDDATTAIQVYGRSHLVRNELATYLAEKVEPEEDDFLLLGFWSLKSSLTTCGETGEVLTAASMPHLALIARLSHAIEPTSCQAERNISALSLLIGSLRTTMGPYKMERLMFIRLNQYLIPEIQELRAVTNAQRARAVDCTKKAVEVQEAAAGTDMEVLI